MLHNGMCAEMFSIFCEVKHGILSKWQQSWHTQCTAYSTQHKTHNSHTDSLDMHTRTVLAYTHGPVCTPTVLAYTHEPVCVYFVQPDCTLTVVCITNEYDVMFTFLHWMRFVCFVSFRLHSVATHKESYETRWTVWGEDLDWIQQNLHRNLFFVLLFWTQHVCVLACESKNGR